MAVCTSSWRLSQHTYMWLRLVELDVTIICSCMLTLKPLLRKTVWATRKSSSKAQTYEYKLRSRPKKVGNSESGDGLTDGSYLELGPQGNNKDVNINAQNPRIAKPDLAHGAILKTQTFEHTIEPNRQ